MAIDAAQILINISHSAGALEKLATGASYVLGVNFMFRALYHLKIYGELRTMMASRTSLKTPLTYIVVGMLMIYIPTAKDIVMNTTFGYDNILAYSRWPGGGNGSLGSAGVAVLRLIQAIGTFAFIRGWIIVAKSSEQEARGAGFGKGITHILGGLAAINIVGTAQVISNTLGISLPNL